MVTTNPLDEEDYQLYHLRKKFYQFEEQSLLDLSKLEAIKDTTEDFENAFNNYAHLYQFLSKALYREIMAFFNLVGLSPMPESTSEAFYMMKNEVFENFYWHNEDIICIFDLLVELELSEQETIDFETFHKVYDICMNQRLLYSLNEYKKRLKMSHEK